MKIGIDIQSTVGSKTGIGYYASNLVEKLTSMREVDVVVYKDERLPELNTVRRIFWENATLPALVKNDNLDIFHVPGFAGPRVKGKTKKITTICDLIGVLYPENLNIVSRFYWQKWLPYCVKNSDAMIAISEHTKKDIMKLLGVPAEKIHVILLAADRKFRPIEDGKIPGFIRGKYGLPDEFFLTAGTIEPRKNIVGLVEAFSAYISGSGSGISLVIAGKKDWGYEKVREKVDELGIADKVIFTGYVPDEDLPVIYNLAKFFVYPSFYEGFGLPVLEAMSCGRPVICSNNSSLPEVAGDAAILIDPSDIKDMKLAIQKMNADEPLRKDLAEKSLRQAGRFSWEKTAAQTLDVYKKTMNA